MSLMMGKPIPGLSQPPALQPVPWTSVLYDAVTLLLLMYGEGQSVRADFAIRDQLASSLPPCSVKAKGQLHKMKLAEFCGEGAPIPSYIFNTERWALTLYGTVVIFELVIMCLPVVVITVIMILGTDFRNANIIHDIQ